MADEQSTPVEKPADKPAVSDLAAQLASHIANKPLGPSAGSAGLQGLRGLPHRPVKASGDHVKIGRRVRPVPREKAVDLLVQGGGAENPAANGAKARHVKVAPREGGRAEPRREGRPEGRQGEGRPGGDRGPRPGGGRFDFPQDIDLEKLINDSLYLDNQAHAVVVRIRDMDSGTRSTLRRLYNSVRRATRAPENERQHEFVMLRARLAYTIARHGLRSLDQIERLLLQVTRKNEARGYERFRDLFEAIVAYNE